MQLPSALLPAAALLAQVASGFYLSVVEDRESEFASYRDDRIGFYDPAGSRPATFKLNEAAELLSGDNLDIAFLDRGDGLWRLESAPITEVGFSCP